jgi:hypothetical protein
MAEAKKLNVYQKLAQVQKNLKAPKGQYNSFGKYHYRSLEDINEAAKPLCVDNGLVLNYYDDIILIGDRYYVKATAKVTDSESGDVIEAYGYAREEESKRGMDGAQVTGGASSYARKYAANGLFSLDDTKDADTDENVVESQNKAKTTTQKKTTTTKKAEPKQDNSELEQLISEIDILVREKVVINKSAVSKLVKDNNNGNSNYREISDLESAKTIKAGLEEIK